ncbi:MAG: TetR/AcrR family transcriptional regulator [Lachnospiraceae bacterium]|nr:TetR/AcrR family transcriptional regulator [Lachnospiraceae bacterium]
MNIKNNQRSKDTEAKIEEVFMNLLSQKHISKITVRELCESAGITRSSFYGHYEDVYDLKEKVEEKMTEEIVHIFQSEYDNHSSDFRVAIIQTIRYIEENQTFFLYFLQNSDLKNIFHIGHISELLTPVYKKEDESKLVFFVGGLNALLLHWLQTGCRESPEQLLDSLPQDYVWDL